MHKKDLIAKAIKEYRWYIYNVCPLPYIHNRGAVEFACKVFEHALYAGYITDLEYKKLVISLPFYLGLF